MSTYLDSSFAVSLYCIDSNSFSVAASMSSAQRPILISPLCSIETSNACRLRVYRGTIPSEEAERSIQNFVRNLQDETFELRAIPENAFQVAADLSARHTQVLGTRGADLLHVAIAITLGADAFYTFDPQQRKLASIVGLTLNPL